MLTSLVIPQGKDATARITGAWTRPRCWDWRGTISWAEPIVALSMMRVGSHLEWARSEKQLKTELDVRQLLGWYDAAGHDVQASFSIGKNGPRSRTMLANASDPPQTFRELLVPVGRVFSFCQPFGTPQIELFGLVIPREQVTDARNGLWRLKESFRDGLSDAWRTMLCYGRAGSLTLGSG